MDAWGILRANSTAPVGSDVWTLINTQAGGAGNVHVGGILTMSISPALGMNNESQELTMNIEPTLGMDLESSELSVNIQNDTEIDLGN